MGRHSRGGSTPPAPEPEPGPDTRFAPRSVEDTGIWDHSTYRVVDVGIPAEDPAPEPAPRYGATRYDLAEDPAPEPGPRYGATRYDLAEAPPYDPIRDAGNYDARGSRPAGRPTDSGFAPRPDGAFRAPDPDNGFPRFGADAGPGPLNGTNGHRPQPDGLNGHRPPADGLNGHRAPADGRNGLRSPADSGPLNGLRSPADSGPRDGLRSPAGFGPRDGLRPSTDGLNGLRAPVEPGPLNGLRAPADSGSRDGLRDGLNGLRAPADPGARDGLRAPGDSGARDGSFRAADSGAGLRPLGDSGAGLRPLDPRSPGDGGSRSFGEPGLRAVDTGARPLAAGVHPLGTPEPPSDEDGGRAARRRADNRRSESRADNRRGENRRAKNRKDRDDEPDRRLTAAADPADPDDAVRYGATRADLVSGTTALAPRTDLPEPDEITDTGARRTRSTFHVAEDPEEHEDEPSLLLQWGVFVAQTLTGAAVGLGVWLGFYRLWSTWPFYAAPAVGVAMIGMLFVARTLRRRHGHDLDLLTAIITIGIGTILTVLPATFTLQNLS